MENKLILYINNHYYLYYVKYFKTFINKMFKTLVNLHTNITGHSNMWTTMWFTHNSNNGNLFSF